MSTPLRVAMVGPLPPERSGIAEYAQGLVAMLRDCGLRVETVTRADGERHGSRWVLDTLRAADVVIYQMGNHPGFHGWMLPYMSEVPGIVHLHDLVVHHMVAGVLDDEQRLSADYSMVLEKWHMPAEIRSACLALRCGMPIWNRDEVVAYPLHQVVTKFATEVIVHSQFAADRISQSTPWLPVHVIPQLYPVIAPHRARESLTRIAVMGGGQMNRRFDWIVQAVTQLDRHLQQPLMLEVAGAVEPAVQALLDGLAGLSHVRLVSHGHVDDEAFWALFARADLMIALREPTMGETSAVVSKALQAGLPTIVSDQGWYAELPACVRKLAVDSRCPLVLAELLQDLIADPTAFQSWAEECEDQAGRASLDPFAATERYAQVLRNNHVLSEFRDHVAGAVVSLKIDTDSPLAAALQAIDVRAGLRGDRWVNRAVAALSDQQLDAYGCVVGATSGAYPYGEPLPENAFQGHVTVVEPDLGAVPPGSIHRLKVELSNKGHLPWYSPMGHALKPFGIYLGHHWQSVDGLTQAVEQPRTWVDDPVEGSASVVQYLTVRAPETPGEYHLEIDLVQESVCWFKSRGFLPARLVVRVEDALQ